MAATRRIQKEYNDLSSDPVPNVSVTPDESNILKWAGHISGPPGSPYAGGKFHLTIDFPVEYPFKAPMIKFTTKIYHMNITEDGNICIGLTKPDNWKPSTKINQVLLSLASLLSEPNTDDALEPAISELYRSDRKKHDAEAKAQTKKYAS